MATATKHPPVQEAGNTSVRVEIFDQASNLRGTDPDYILKLAEYVDGKMRAVADQTHTVDSSRLAVLAALNIADEYHLLKSKQDGGMSDSSKRARRLLEDTDLPVEAVARDAGFGSAALLRHHFTRCTGITPTAFRTQRRLPA